MAILAVVTLGIYYERLTLIQRLWCFAATVFGTIVATGNILLILAVTCCVWAGRWLIERRICIGATVFLSISLGVLYVLAILPNYLFFGRATTSPIAHVFLAARLF